MTIHLYGFILGLAVVAALTALEHVLKRERWLSEQRTFSWGSLAVVGLGIVGARLYHVVTDWPLYADQWWTALAVWRGGLGMYGAMIGGFAALWGWHHFVRPPRSLLAWADAAALGLPLAQALGRWGNLVNHELYGRPSSAPWALAVPAPYRLPGYENSTHFHPLFLYESVALALVWAALWWLWRHTHREPTLKRVFGLGSGTMLALYCLSYGVIRFSLEFLRIVSAPGPLGLTVAQWWSLALIAVGLFFMARAARTLVTVLATFVAAIWLTSTAVQAQTPAFDLSVSPSVVEVALMPGKLVTQAIQVENAGQYDVVITPTLHDFIADNESGIPQLQTATTFPYARLDNADYQLNTPFALRAGESTQLVVALDPPETAPERDWYFTLLLTAVPDQSTSVAQVAASSRGAVGVNFLVSVTPTDALEREWGLTLQRLPRFMDSLQSITFDVIAENRSTHVGTPDLRILVLDARKQVVYEATGLAERVLAGSRRSLQAAQTDPQDPRSLQGAPFTFDPLFAWGPYTVRATIRNGTNGPVIMEQTVWALPFSLLLAAAFALVVLLGARRWRRTRSGSETLPREN